MTKQRFYTTPSSLGSYFGVGFNSPQEQIELDLGLAEAVFDDEAKARLLLGKTLEDSVLDYFEESMGITISNRNDEMLYFYDGKIKGIMDGMTELNGIKTVVECKVSNSQSYVFTENMGYILQCQAYMLATDTEQAMLCGLYQGKPIYKIIKRDEELIADIKTITDFIVLVLMGLEEFQNFPVDILAKYSDTTILPPIDDITPEEKKDVQELIEIKEQMKILEKRKKEIEGYLKTNFEEGIFQNNNFKLTIASQSRKGSLDEARLSIEHPEIDLYKYRKPASSFKVIRTLAKKDK